MRGAAGRLQHVAGIALLVDGFIRGGRHEHDVVAVGVAHRFGELRRRRLEAGGAEAHVDRLRAVVDGVKDRLRDTGLGEVAFLDQQVAPVAGCRKADAVVGVGAGQPGDVRAVPGAIDGGGAFVRFAVDVVRVGDLADEIGA